MGQIQTIVPEKTPEKSTRRSWEYPYKVDVERRPMRIRQEGEKVINPRLVALIRLKLDTLINLAVTFERFQSPSDLQNEVDRVVENTNIPVSQREALFKLTNALAEALSPEQEEQRRQEEPSQQSEHASL